MIVNIGFLRSVIVVRTAAFCLLTAYVAAMSQSAHADESQPAGTSIVFERDIQPILAQHCYRCHGRDKQEAGLRLDSRAHAERGGDSGRPILGSDLKTNLLYQRVASSDAEIRMPRDADRLKAAQIDLIAEWVRQKTPWPTSVGAQPNSTADGSPKVGGSPKSDDSLKASYYRLLYQLDDLLERYTYLMWLGKFGLILFVLALVAVMCRISKRKQRSWTTRRARRVVNLVCVLRFSHFLILFLAVVLIVSGRDLIDKIATLTTERDGYAKKLSFPERLLVSEHFYGSPPVPVRPSRPKQIGGTYYRGNCERSPQLFNGGNYRTATFHLGLYDSDYKRVEAGARVKPGVLYIRFEIERAPKTASAFFHKSTMTQIFLSENTTKYPSSHNASTEPVRLKTIEESQRWEAYYPIGHVKGMKEETISGLLYVVTGSPVKKTVIGITQYGIKYDLRFAGGTLHKDSDLWMGELFITNPIAPPRLDKVPLREWFDYRPIPVITGENTKDPKLLGIEKNISDAP